MDQTITFWKPGDSELGNHPFLGANCRYVSFREDIQLSWTVKTLQTKEPKEWNQCTWRFLSGKSKTFDVNNDVLKGRNLSHKPFWQRWISNIFLRWSDFTISQENLPFLKQTAYASCKNRERERERDSHFKRENKRSPKALNLLNQSPKVSNLSKNLLKMNLFSFKLTFCWPQTFSEVPCFQLSVVVLGHLCQIRSELFMMSFALGINMWCNKYGAIVCLPCSL